MAGKRINPILKVFIQGVYDKNSNISLLYGIPHVVQLIWKNVINYWKENIDVFKEIDLYIVSQNKLKVIPDGAGFIELFSDIKLPKPRDININMMPFILNKNFKGTKLPKNIEPYWDCLLKHLTYRNYNECGKVWYLTIQENIVEKNESQRRPGLHTDRPGVVYRSGNRIENSKGDFNKGEGTCRIFSEYVHWGRGFQNSHKEIGGIYMVSNIDNSCNVWNCKITKDSNMNEIIGPLGDVEHLREFLPQAQPMKANSVYWITDRTPHESLRMQKRCYRQFVRVVTSEVSVWYKDHSTKNPFGVVPDPKITKIIEGCKFHKNTMHIVENF